MHAFSSSLTPSKMTHSTLGDRASVNQTGAHVVV